jgi:hypothetical protein
MNKRERLIAETFGDNEGASFARVAAAHARRRRAAKQLVAIAAATTAVAAIVISLRQSPPAATQPIPYAKAPVPTVEIISDDELRAHLKDQPVLFLKDQTGITSVIFLANASSPGLETDVIPH